MEQGQQPAGPAFGRKVFFLNPSFSVRTHIITLLRVLEYEVYTISDYRRVKSYLRVHHDAVLFINTESQLHIPAWQNLIKSIKQDSVFNSTIIGIVNEHLSPTELKLLTDDPNITGGVFHLEGQFKAILPTIERKLNDLGAKGRRQYVRTICMNDTSARFLWIQDGKLFTAQIVDISTASVAVLITQKELPFVQGRGEIFATIQLGQKQIQTKAKVLVIKPSGNNFAAIFIINEQTPQESIQAIREYVFETLEIAMLKTVEGLSIDKTDYTIGTK